MIHVYYYGHSFLLHKESVMKNRVITYDFENSPPHLQEFQFFIPQRLVYWEFGDTILISQPGKVKEDI